MYAHVNYVYHYLQKHLWIGRIPHQLKEEVLAADEMMLSLYRHTWGQKLCVNVIIFEVKLLIYSGLTARCPPVSGQVEASGRNKAYFLHRSWKCSTYFKISPSFKTLEQISLENIHNYRNPTARCLR